MLEFLVIPITMALGMLGGQGQKLYRRYGISIISSISTALILEKKPARKAYIAWLLLIAWLSGGYGEHSILMKIFKHDWLVRIVYGAILGSIFLIFGFWWAPMAFASAYVVRAGGFPLWGRDWLWEDYVRFNVLGVHIYLVITL